MNKIFNFSLLIFNLICGLFDLIMDNNSHSAEKQKQFFNEHALTWDSDNSHDTHKLEFIAALLDLKAGQTVLDVGTGTGVMVPYLLKWVQPEGKIEGKIIGVDFSEKMIDIVRSRFKKEDYPNLEFVVKEINEFQMDAQFDAILCYSCFPHFVEPEKTLRHLVMGLKSGGKLMIAHSESRHAINNMHEESDQQVKYAYLPKIIELQRMMESFGLEVLRKVDSKEMFIILAKKRD